MTTIKSPILDWIARMIGCALISCVATTSAVAQSDKAPAESIIQGPWQWRCSEPLIGVEERAQEPSHAQKDPTVVYVDGQWHVFMTVKLPSRSAIEYCSFEKWDQAHVAKRHLLPLSDSDYFCAPQVFYFEPQGKWYLVYQVGMPQTKMMWVAYSTTEDIADPNSWSQARPMLDGDSDDPRQVGGLDYWIICDGDRAYLFYTSLNGKLWRLWTTLNEFPMGFRDCQLALEGPFFEASHTYRLVGLNQYLTIVEEKGKRYFKAYLADRLDGEWRPLAVTAENPFASWRNMTPAAGVQLWTDNVSHGELIRYSNDQRLLLDPEHLRFVFQGMFEKDKRGSSYGKFSWRIGMLEALSKPE